MTPETPTPETDAAEYHPIADNFAYVVDAEVARKLERERNEAILARDLAIAHDSQPYPTAEAYERICVCYKVICVERDKLREVLERIARNMKGSAERWEKTPQFRDAELGAIVAAQHIAENAISK